MEEKRVFTRFSFNKKIIFTTDTGEKYDVEVDNLSLRGGSFIVNDSINFDLGTHLSFILNFYEDEDIIVKGDGVVVWRNGSTYGIQFNNMAADYFSHLKRLLELNYSEE
jgi:hypothetical protein